MGKRAGVEVTISNQIQVERWRKYTWNCTFNIISAITMLPLDKILENKYLHQLCVDTIKEIEILAMKEGVDFDEPNFVEARIKYARQLGNFKTSTLQDIEKGKQIELDAFTGYIVDLAKKHEVEVPINRTLYALLSAK